MDLRLTDLPVQMEGCYYDAPYRPLRWYHRVRDWWRRQFTSLHRGPR
jgi:hypothetical protein